MTAVEELAEAIERSLPWISGGPTLAEFGHARVDCALAHIDYFAGVNMAAGALAQAVGEITGENGQEVRARLGVKERSCDCSACIGSEASKAREDEIKAGYTLVEKFKEVSDA